MMFGLGARRALSRAAQRRGMASHAPHGHGHGPAVTPKEATHSGRTALPHEIEEELHAEGMRRVAGVTTVTWKRISYFIALPGIAATTYAAFGGDKHHTEEKKPFVAYGTYMNVRNKPFPWGDGEKTLFWNDHVNHLSTPAGEEEHAQEEWKNPIAAWVEYHMTPEEQTREQAHDYLRTMKAKADANKAYSKSLAEPASEATHEH